jgi:hypothetical protein
MDQWSMLVPADSGRWCRRQPGVHQAVRGPGVEVVTERGLDVVTSTPDQFAAVIKADTATSRW